MRLRFKLAILFGVLFAAGVWVATFARLLTPIREGTSAGFWRHACGVDLNRSGKDELWGVFYPSRDGWFIYYDQGMHGQTVYRVEESVALRDFPRIRAKIEPGPEVPADFWGRRALTAWKHADPEMKDGNALLREIQATRLVHFRDEDPELARYRSDMEEAFEVRWTRAKRYWLTVLFEFAVLAGLIIFTAMPWLRNAGRLAWSLHVGCLPVLLFVPWLLGYAPATFTSLFPAGGIVYPFILIPFRGLPWTKVDTVIVEHMPRLLEPLSQLSGPWMAVTGMGAPGPLAIVGVGLVLGVSCFPAATFIARVRRKTPAL